MIGRNYLQVDNLSGESELLSQFIEMAVDTEDMRSRDQEEDYLSLFMSHSKDPPERYDDVMKESNEDKGVDIKFSKFISSYSQLDHSSGIGPIRLTSVVIPAIGMTVMGDDMSLLCYTLSGEGEIIADGRGIRCRKYDCVWIDCRRRVQYRAAPGRPWECAFIRIHGNPRSDFFSQACRRIGSEGLISLTFGAGSRFRSLIWQLLGPQIESSPDPDAMYTHLLLSLFIEIELAVVSTSVKQVIVPDIIVGMQNYIDRNYSQEITLDALSERFSISKFHMSREFKKYVGKSPNDYLINVRIEKSKELLVDSRRTIVDIAQLVGIPNTNHFLYLFKTREGITPSAFRKRVI